MSVINQMLKDLEKREQHAPVSATSPLVSGGRVERPPENLNFRWLAAVVLLVLLLLAGGWWLFAGNSPLPSTPVTEVAEPTAVVQSTKMQGKPVLAGDNLAGKSEPQQPLTVVDAADRLSMVAQQNVPLVIEQPTDDPVRPQADLPVAKAKPQAKPEKMPDDKAVAVVAPKVEPVTETKAVVAPAPVVAEPPKAPKVMAIKEVRLSQSELAAAKFRKAEERIEAGDISGAQDLLRQVLAIKPDQAKARARLASLYYGQKNSGEAAKILSEGLKIQPGNVEFRLMLARIFQQGKNERQALAYLNQGPLPAAEDVDFHALRGALAQQLKQYADAVSSYRLLAQYQPEQGRWWLGWGIAADGLNDTQTALAAFQQALKSRNLSASAVGYAKKRIQQLGEL
ncbi:tetratricopeptide repeat protein [Corallincola spongiicola]|uniref:Tetratricopeptide repeat protein n=1 Tax=Corallincola spongiicola TaxID=2520508 RepID=A0ABY1WNS4_9GAMM|nr:tetratricopeptide repeat protein [Corallincola spongiicola]TAA45199.1 tetratricopeptide repeat protein [Corallincola spongiicola]